MAEPIAVEGLFDNIKLLTKYAPLIAELRKLPEFWLLIKAGNLDKAGDIVEDIGTKLGFGDIGKELDDLFDAIEAKSIPATLRSIGDGCHIAADMLEGKKADPIRLPVMHAAGPVTVESVSAAIEAYGLDKPPTVAAGEPVPVKNPMVIIGLIGLGLQVFKLIWESRKSKK